MKTTIVFTNCILLIFLTGCTRSTEPKIVEPQEQLFKIKIDSVQFQKTITLGDTVTLQLLGFVGPSTCYSFSHFENVLHSSMLDLTAWGKYIPTNPCLQILLGLNTQYQFVPTNKGLTQIIIHQPDGSALVDTVIAL